MTVFNMKRIISSKNMRPFDLNVNLYEGDWDGFYRTADGDFIEAHDYMDFDYDMENYDYYGDEEPDNPIVGGVYWEDLYDEGGLKIYTGDETLRDFHESGFITGLEECVVAPGEKGYDKFDEIFFDDSLEPDEKKAMLEDLIQRLGLGRGRPRR